MVHGLVGLNLSRALFSHSLDPVVSVFRAYNDFLRHGRW